MRKQAWQSLLGSALIIGGALLGGSYFWNRHAADHAQREAREVLDHSVAERRAGPGIPVSSHHTPRRGEVLGELSVPRLHLSTIVFEGDDAAILNRGAGHIPGTALPEGSGNVGIAAHRDTCFRPLRLIHLGDLITLKTPSGMWRYSVTTTEIVSPSDIDVLANAPGRDLTLVTCYPFYFVGRAPRRFIVHARKVE